MRQRLFTGSFPTDVDLRWDCIYRFVQQWCSRDAKLNLGNVSFDDLESVQHARDSYCDQLSISIQRWFAMVEHSAQRGVPRLHDYAMLEPIHDHFADIDPNQFLVLLMQGESDVFWCVHEAHLSETDPPVTVLWQTGKRRPDVIGNIGSVSEFSLIHLFWYNTYAVNCRRWFPADLDGNEMRSVTTWMDCTLRLHDGKRAVEVWENDDAAAIVTEQGWELSLFADPDSILLPSILRTRMQEHRRLNRQ